MERSALLFKNEINQKNSEMKIMMMEQQVKEQQRIIHLFKNDPEKIDGSLLSHNPSIFKKRINYKYLYQRMNIIREELMIKCMHPSRLERRIEMGGDIDDF